MRTLRLIALIIVIAVSSVAPVIGAENNRIDRWFVFGTNLAWFHNAYGTDIGPNHAEGWGTSFSRDECERVFANLHRMGCPVVRIWAMERQEGLVFTKDLTTDPKYPYHEVVGLDPVFLANCDTIMEIAAKHGVMVYWSLLNHLIREEQGGRHMRIITDAKVRRSWIDNAAVPFVKRYAGRRELFAIDVMNEVDGAIGGVDALTGCFKVNQGCSWKVMRTFIKEVVAAIHERAPGVKVTATSGWHGWKNVKAGRFSGLGLDFYDWHSYIDDPDLPHCRELKLDKPCIIGEIGPKTEKPDAGYALQGKNWAKYFEEARKGYAGVLSWSYGNAGEDNNFTMVAADHSWRAGADVMYRYSRGDLMPDCGPQLYNTAEESELAAINAVAGKVLALANDGTLAGDAKIGKRWKGLSAWLKSYFPYVNLRYANIVFGKMTAEVLALARESGVPTAGAAESASRARLRALAGDMWGAGNDPTVREHFGMLQLARLAGITPEAVTQGDSLQDPAITPGAATGVTVQAEGANPFGN